MRNIILFDTEGNHKDLLPIAFTRPVCEIRVGIMTISEKWKRFVSGDYSILTVDYLREKYAFKELPDSEESLYIAGRLIPDENVARAVGSLGSGEMLVDDETHLILACRCDAPTFANLDPDATMEEGNRSLTPVMYHGKARCLEFLFHIFQYNGEEICNDYEALTKGRTGKPLDASNRVLGSPYLPDGNASIFIEEGASVEAATLNVKEGPIYIGRDAKVMEGACLRGPIAICDGSKVHIGAKMYKDTTIGPMCKVGGEINNVVMLGHSNKAHDGYLGNAVIGEWCNIGAGANASNLKNDYSKIRLWNYRRHTFMRTELQFCGLIMGDHSKAGINCMFNTATVVGVGCNIHGAGFPRVFIPSFSEGSPTSGFTDVPLKKFFDIASRCMARRDLKVSDTDRRIFERVAEVASQFK